MTANSKPAIKSTGVVGSVIVILSILSQALLGVEIGVENLEQIVVLATSLFGAVMALVGRIKASEKVRGIFRAK